MSKPVADGSGAKARAGRNRPTNCPTGAGTGSVELAVVMGGDDAQLIGRSGGSVEAACGSGGIDVEREREAAARRRRDLTGRPVMRRLPMEVERRDRTAGLAGGGEADSGADNARRAEATDRDRRSGERQAERRWAQAVALRRQQAGWRQATTKAGGGEADAGRW